MPKVIPAASPESGAILQQIAVEHGRAKRVPWGRIFAANPRWRSVLGAQTTYGQNKLKAYFEDHKRELKLAAARAAAQSVEKNEQAEEIIPAPVARNGSNGHSSPRLSTVGAFSLNLCPHCAEVLEKAYDYVERMRADGVIV